MNRIKRVFGVLAFFTMTAIPVLSQVRISIDQYPPVGTENTYYADTTGSVTVDLGNPGQGQAWDFTQDLQAGSFMQVYADPSDDTLYYDEAFSAAEWVRTGKQFLSLNPIPYLLPDGAEGLFALHYFEYKDTDAVKAIGMGTANPVYSGTVDFYEDQVQYLFPLEYGKSWVRKSEYDKTIQVVIGVPVDVELIACDLSSVEVDGCGTLTVPAGVFECVRLKIHRTFSLKVYVKSTGYKVAELNEQFIAYEWVSADIGTVLEVVSHSEEDNEDFTDASLVVRLENSTNLTNAVCDPDCGTGGDIPRDFTIHQNFPNPFNPSTSIGYTLDRPAQVDVRIFTATGQLVQRINRGIQQQGYHSIVWNAAASGKKLLPAGIYMYHITAKPVDGGPARSMSRKMLLVK